MIESLHILFGKRKYLSGLILLSFTVVICAAVIMTGSDDFDMARREILLRRIGDELLTQSGDSQSRVLPVQKISGNEYLIRFEHEFTFKPDSLMKITRRLLAQDPSASDYVVNVLNCGTSSVAYGYAISSDKKDDIIACSGRVQPKGCYMVDIKFKPTGINTAKNGYMLGFLSFSAFVGFFFLRTGKPQRAEAGDQDTGILTFGSVLFNTQERQLVINESTIDLTATEARLLLIFALSPNQTIERSRLQKEIWEDEGVIVGRSLDMFISKLRKKLESDPDVRIAVVRGKGYKLEISSE
jgi:hypothetical protein